MGRLPRASSPISQPGKVGMGRASASRSGLLGHSAGAFAGKPGAFSDFLGRPNSILFRKFSCAEHVGLSPAGWRSLGFLSWFVSHRPARGGLLLTFSFLPTRIAECFWEAFGPDCQGQSPFHHLPVDGGKGSKWYFIALIPGIFPLCLA